MKNRLFVLTQKVSWRTQIIVGLFFVNVVLMSCLSAFYYTGAITLLKRELERSNRELLSLLSVNVNETFEDATDILYRLSFNETIRSVMASDSTPGQVQLQMQEQSALAPILGPLSNDPIVHQVKVYFTTPRVYTENSFRYFSLEDAKASEWYHDAVSRPEEVCWSSPYRNGVGGYPNMKTISAARSVMSWDGSGKLLGFVSVDINAGLLLSQIMQQTQSALGGEIYVVNEKGLVNCSFDRSRIGNSINSVDGLEQVDLNEREAQFLAGSLVLTQPLSISGWNLVAKVPLDEFRTELSDIVGRMALTFAAIFIVAFLVSLAFSGAVSRRLKGLLTAARGYVEEGNEQSGDEFVELESLFHKMERENQSLAAEIYRERLQKQEAQLSFLQAQIDPHLLYNMLDLINWMVIGGESKEASDTLKALAHFYRVRLSGGETIVTIEHELECAKAYLELQNIRHENAVEAFFDVDPQILGYPICSMLLQPLVENSIRHGILEKDDPRGRIVITGRVEDGEIVLTVDDDGVGLDQRLADRINRGEVGSKRGGYGFASVNKRISLLLGEQYGAQIIPLEHGARVRIHLPMLRMLAQNETADQPGGEENPQ